jgi:hypothetical protein
MKWLQVRNAVEIKNIRMSATRWTHGAVNIAITCVMCVKKTTRRTRKTPLISLLLVGTFGFNLVAYHWRCMSSQRKFCVFKVVKVVITCSQWA